jgi:hypothetical protein
VERVIGRSSIEGFVPTAPDGSWSTHTEFHNAVLDTRTQTVYISAFCIDAPFRQGEEIGTAGYRSQVVTVLPLFP